MGCCCNYNLACIVSLSGLSNYDIGARNYFCHNFDDLWAYIRCPFLFRAAEDVDLEQSAKAIEVNDKMKGAMYFA